MSKENVELHKTKLRIEIDKTIQPKQFEPLKIITDIEETFYWRNKEERDNKMKRYREEITKDFINAFDEVVTKLGEKDRCIGRVVVENNKSNTDSESDESDESDEFTVF